MNRLTIAGLFVLSSGLAMGGNIFGIWLVIIGLVLLVCGYVVEQPLSK